MKRIILLVTFLVCLSVSSSGQVQNLVPNGDFEEYWQLPYQLAQWNFCAVWSNGGGQGSPDYYHTLGTAFANLPYSNMAYVKPYSGNAIMGFVSRNSMFGEYSEYISVELTEPMIIGKSYNVSFYITNGEQNQCGMGSNRVGVQFSTLPLLQSGPYTIIEGTPQYEIWDDLWETEWRRIAFDFIADSSYTNLMMGNFRHNGITVLTPHLTSTFGDPSAYYYVDKIEVKFSTEVIMPNVFTPSGDGVNDYFKPVFDPNMSLFNMAIYNRWGEKIYEGSDPDAGWNGEWKGKSCSDGVYFWKVNYLDVYGKMHNTSGYFTLINE